MKKALVAYFSASGVTADLAKKFAQAAQADLYEIQPKVPYTQEDLDWRNPKSRSSVEMQNKELRPEMVDTPVNIAAYDTVFLGFPIWWYVAPTIVNTFLEAHDFSGKKIVLFATAGSSPFGDTVQELQGSVAPDTEIVTSKVFYAKDAPVDLQELVGAYL